MINYLGYKFLLFCKVSTQPRRSIARWVCSQETEQPSPQQMHLKVGAREEEEMSSRVESTWLVAWPEDKDPRRGAKEGRGTRVPEHWASMGAAWGGGGVPLGGGSPSSALPSSFLSPRWAALATTTHLPGQPPNTAFTARPGLLNFNFPICTMGAVWHLSCP